jgi:uncharacterized membrane protein
MRQLPYSVQEPQALQTWLPRGIAIFAAALSGMGVVMWIAANWDTWGRVGHFVLLQSLVLAAGLGAALHPSTRSALGLLVFLGIGSLFAYFGQTYQTGADPWQLFALWAVLALPLCMGARSDVLWAPWALVAMTAVGLWAHTFSGHRWSAEPDQLRVHMLAWTVVLALAGALSKGLQHYTGAGTWAFRTAATLGICAITMTGLGGLFHDPVAQQYPLSLVVLAVGAGALVHPKRFEVFALSAVALGLNTLLVCGLVRWLSNMGDRLWDGLGLLILIGLFAAGTLAASVNCVLRLARRYATTSTGDRA